MQGSGAIHGAICRPGKPSGLVLLHLNQRALLTPYVPIYIKKGDMDHTNFEVVNQDFSHNLPTIGSQLKALSLTRRVESILKSLTCDMLFYDCKAQGSAETARMDMIP